VNTFSPRTGSGLGLGKSPASDLCDRGPTIADSAQHGGRRLQLELWFEETGKNTISAYNSELILHCAGHIHTTFDIWTKRNLSLKLMRGVVCEPPEGPYAFAVTRARLRANHFGMEDRMARPLLSIGKCRVLYGPSRRFGLIAWPNVLRARGTSKADHQCIPSNQIGLDPPLQ
jgi:hypothetical protein